MRRDQAIMLVFRHTGTKKTDPISKAGFRLHFSSALKKLPYVMIHGKIHSILSRKGLYVFGPSTSPQRIALFVFSFFIPGIIKKMKGKVTPEKEI